MSFWKNLIRRSPNGHWELVPPSSSSLRCWIFVTLILTVVFVIFTLCVSSSYGVDADPWGDLLAFVAIPAGISYFVGIFLGTRARQKR